jgi:hypothetical protein
MNNYPHYNHPEYTSKRLGDLAHFVTGKSDRLNFPFALAASFIAVHKSADYGMRGNNTSILATIIRF